MENKSLKEEAQAYEAPARTKNISELPQVSVDLQLEAETFKTKDGEDFVVKSIKVDGLKYRVPNSVINQLKVLIEDNPNIKNFKVKKTGTGLDTEYIVIPLL